jgi:hypothetical protein
MAANEMEIEDFVLEFPQIESLIQEKKRLLQDNVGKAYENLNSQEEIERLRGDY